MSVAFSALRSNRGSRSLSNRHIEIRKFRSLPHAVLGATWIVNLAPSNEIYDYGMYVGCIIVFRGYGYFPDCGDREGYQDREKVGEPKEPTRDHDNDNRNSNNAGGMTKRPLVGWVPYFDIGRVRATNRLDHRSLLNQFFSTDKITDTTKLDRIGEQSPQVGR